MARRHIDREKTIQRICDALKAGNLRKTACLYAGITQETFYQWLKNPELSELIEQAEAQAQVFHVTNVRRGADKDWKASAWWLQHYVGTKQDWKPLQAHEHSGPDGGAIEFKSVANAFDYRLAALLEREGPGDDPFEPDGRGEGGSVLPVGALGETEPDTS